MKKSGFVLYAQQYESVKHLSLEDKGRLFDAIFQYHIQETTPEDLPPVVAMALSFIKTAMDIDYEKYLKRAGANRENGKRGGRPKNPTEPKKPIGLNGNPKNPTEPKKPDKDKDKDLKEKTNKKEIAFKNSIQPFVEKYGKDICNNFYQYWSEPNPSKTKLRYEMEKTWDVSRRLANWASRSKDFKNNGKTEITPSYAKLD